MFRKDFEAFCSAHSWYKIHNDDYHVAIIPVINASGRDFSMSENTKDNSIKLLVHSVDIYLPHLKSLNNVIYKLISKNTMQIDSSNYSSQKKYEEFETKVRNILNGIVDFVIHPNSKIKLNDLFEKILNYEMLKKRRLESIIPL
jgi:uncharacterized Fe-S radical SAM superfamily protein PflX